MAAVRGRLTRISQINWVKIIIHNDRFAQIRLWWAKMKVKIAKKNQIKRITDLIESCVTDMKKSKTYQWNEQYPTREIVTQDIENKELWVVLEKKKVIAMVVITKEQEEEYDSVDWKDSCGKSVVVHRLAVHPKKRREGIAKKLMDHAEKYAKESGFTSIRLDTYSKNPVAIRLYEKRGYRRCGEIYFPHQKSSFYCYELIFDEAAEGTT